MNRKEKCEDARHEAWDKTKNVKDRIKRLKKVVDEYPEFILPLSDLAVTYLKINDKPNTIKTYQKIVDLKDTFVDGWDNELGKAYLFTGNYDMTIKTIEGFCGHDYSIGLFLAFAYLKKGDSDQFKKHFDKWISDDLRKSFKHYDHQKEINFLFNKEISSLIKNTWDQYYNKYSNMEPYQLYCARYKEYHNNMNSEISPKLSKTKFEELSSEYDYIDRKLMFGDEEDIDEKDLKRWEDLQDLIFTDLI